MITPELCKEARRQFAAAMRHRVGDVCVFSHAHPRSRHYFPAYVMDRTGYGLGWVDV